MWGFVEPKRWVLQKSTNFVQQWQWRLAAFPSMWLLPGGLKFLWTNTSRLEPSKHLYSLFMFFHWYCSGFTIFIDDIHVFFPSHDFACLQSRKCRRRHPCKSQDVPWRSAMAWECRRFIGFTAVQTIRVFGRQMQKWWRWKPWKWCRHRWRELFNGNCFVLGQLFPIRSNSQGSSAYDNRETWHYYTADPKAPRFCQLDGAVLDWNLWRWTWCPLTFEGFNLYHANDWVIQTSHSRDNMDKVAAMSSFLV